MMPEIDQSLITGPRRKRAASGGRGGSAVIEFAITFPMLIFMMGSLFQLGHAFLVYNALEGAVRGGARYAAVTDFDAPDGVEFSEAVKKMVVYGTPSPNGQNPLVPGLSLENVIVESLQDGAGMPISVSVSITEFPLLKILSQVTLIDKPKSTFIFMGQFKSAS